MVNFPTQYWHKLDDGRIQCDLCPRTCKLKEGQRGFCFVRQRKNNQIVLTTFGLSTGFCIDPIEKKPLNHFLPGTPVLSFGTAGCNLGCKFCQNWNISASKETTILSAKAMPDQIAQSALDHRCKSVAFTYNEPTIFMEYGIEVAKACHELGIKTIAVSNGYINEKPRREFYRYIDAANIDLKGFTNNFYNKITYSSLPPVLNTLIYLKHETNVWLEITTLLIPGKNDSNKEIDQLSRWIMKNLGPDVPLHFSAFFPAFKMQDIPPTPLENLTRARDIAIKNGLWYVYTGNSYNVENSTTYCHHCKKAIIQRAGYEILNYQLDKKGHCKFCQTPCSGVFEKKPGTWGNKRHPINI